MGGSKTRMGLQTLCAGAVVCSVMGAAGVTSVAMPTVAAASGPTVALSQNVLPGIANLHSTGPVSPSAAIHLGISLHRPDPAGEAALVQKLYDPSSPMFHQFLSPAEFNQLFGVEPQRFDALVAWLKSGALAVTSVPGSHDYVLASGTAAQVERLFHTRLQNFNVGGRNFYANTVAPAVPVSLGVNYILGLNSLEGPRKPAIGPNTGLITPKELWSVYNQPDANKGEGQSMAIFGWGVTDGVDADLRTFEHQFGFPGIPLAIQYYGSASIPITDTTGAGEWRLDTQASTGMAPNANSETLYFGRDGSDASIIAAYQAWANDPSGPLQGSSSFSGCETSPQIPASQQDTVFQPAAELVLSQAVAEGRTMFASTGDTGASCPILPVNLNGVGTEAIPLLGYPAASPFAVGVGGTILYTDGNTPAARTQETTWTHSGGGTSPYIKAPAYQLGIPPLQGGPIFDCTTDESGTPYPAGTLCRGIPDVAAISGDIVSNGYPITVSGAQNSQGAGTSLSSPLWLGMWTRLQAAAPTPFCATCGPGASAVGGKGFANPIFYTQGKNAVTYAADFYDIGGATDGHTAPTCILSPIYCSHVGWDYGSGWGVPHLDQLIKDVDGTDIPLCSTNQSCPPLQPIPGGGGTGPNINPCGPLFTVAGGEADAYLIQGQNLGVTTFPTQLDVISGNMQNDGTTLKITLTLAGLNTTLPTGSGENDYRVLWNNGSTKYFALATVEPGTPPAPVIFSDGQAIVTPATTRYQTLNVDTGFFGNGPGGPNVVEIDIPLTNVNAPSGTALTAITGETDVRSGTAQAGLLNTEDTAGPGFDYQIGQACSTIPRVPEAPVTTALVIAGGATVAILWLTRRRRSKMASARRRLL